jgi:hypothetical protein
MYGGQISYDLRRLRAHQIIERIPHSRSCQLTADGMSTVLSFTRLTKRVIVQPRPVTKRRSRQASVVTRNPR